MCGKEFRKYVESTAIIIFFVYFPTKYTIFLFVECTAVMEILLTRTYSRTNIVSDYVMSWSFQPSDFVEQLYRLLGSRNGLKILLAVVLKNGSNPLHNGKRLCQIPVCLGAFLVQLHLRSSQAPQ